MRNPLRTPIEEAMIRGESSINLDERPINQVILGFPLRGLFIKHKAIFQKAVSAYAYILPSPRTTNTTGHWTAPFMEALDKLVEYVNYKRGFFRDVRKIVLNEIEHDSLYRDPILFILEQIIEAVLDGRVPPREADKPDKKYWNEPKPYGGKHTIIHRIRENREAINDILGRRNV